MIGTLGAWRAYTEARGNQLPTNAPDPAALAALQRASDYIRFHYVRQFVATYDETSPYVEEATYEAASLELIVPGFFSQTFTPDQQKVLTEVKGIKWTVIPGATDSADAWANATPTSTIVAAMLDPYMPGKASFGLRAVGG